MGTITITFLGRRRLTRGWWTTFLAELVGLGVELGGLSLQDGGSGLLLLERESMGHQDMSVHVCRHLVTCFQVRGCDIACGVTIFSWLSVIAVGKVTMLPRSIRHCRNCEEDDCEETSEDKLVATNDGNKEEADVVSSDRELVVTEGEADEVIGKTVIEEETDVVASDNELVVIEREDDEVTSDRKLVVTEEETESVL